MPEPPGIVVIFVPQMMQRISFISVFTARFNDIITSQKILVDVGKRVSITALLPSASPMLSSVIVKVVGSDGGSIGN